MLSQQAQTRQHLVVERSTALLYLVAYHDEHHASKHHEHRPQEEVKPARTTETGHDIALANDPKIARTPSKKRRSGAKQKARLKRYVGT